MECELNFVGESVGFAVKFVVSIPKIVFALALTMIQ